MSNTPEKRARKCGKCIYNALNFMVFLLLDFLESILCVVYKCLDKFLEGKSSACYCSNKLGSSEGDDEVSESLYGRRNVFLESARLFSFPEKWNNKPEPGNRSQVKAVRWSDCSCESCVAWTKDGSGKRLHVVVLEPSGGTSRLIEKKAENNVIFIHGFLCSSSFWTESVFQNLSEAARQSYRLFAVDLLGFGRSPKPMDCLYTIKDHLEMIEKSVINPYELKSFHLVAHSMGCVIALAMAAKYSKFIKSVTLVAPACFSCGKDEDSVEVLKRLANKTIAPPVAFHISVMAWYEHLGRSLCFLICRHHLTWERLLKLLTRRRDLSFAIKDLTKHTHHSAWHNVHNVICGGSKLVDGFLEILEQSGAQVYVIHGDNDTTIPVESSHHIKAKLPSSDLRIIPHADHSSVILRRKKDFTRSLELIWDSTRRKI